MEAESNILGKSPKEQLKMYGQSINKSKATISKYENNEIIPDTITLLEICNSLHISLNELFFLKNENNSNNNKTPLNPFHTSKLYLYYYTDKKLMLSIIDIYYENNILKCRFFNGVKNFEDVYYKKCAYYYEGLLDADKTTAYFNFTSKTNMLEKVQIVINIPWSHEVNICKGLILGLTPNALPIVKKVIISPLKIKDISKYNEFLTFSKEDVKKIYHDGALIIENKNYDEFFFNV